jgi:O-phosphoseryl-tRNA(Cys) synthetase
MKNRRKIIVQPLFRMIAAFAIVTGIFLTRAQAQDTKGETVAASVTVTAKVTSVDLKTRKVKVVTDDGKKYSFIAGDNVVNLPQVKKGDIITAVYTEAIAYQVRKHNKETGVTVTDAAAAAQPGQKPAGAVMQQTTVAVTITAIDPTVPSVTFKGPEGNVRTIKIKDPQKLNGVKVGDVVDITYTEAIAIKVDPAAK